MTSKRFQGKKHVLLAGTFVGSLLIASSAMAVDWPSAWVSGRPAVQQVVPLRPAAQLPSVGGSVVAVPRPSQASQFKQIGEVASSSSAEVTSSSSEPLFDDEVSSSSEASSYEASSASSAVLDASVSNEPISSSSVETASSMAPLSASATSEETPSEDPVTPSASSEFVPSSSAPLSLEPRLLPSSSASSSEDEVLTSSSSSTELSSTSSLELPSQQPQVSAADACRQKVATVADENAILFQPGSATLTAGSLPVLDQLASDLKLCPDEAVHVEGHTDADGLADANLALSVARAEAVVAALVQRGIDQSRLYAEGFGESAPIAPNDTKAGKALNRRIAFRIGND